MQMVNGSKASTPTHKKRAKSSRAKQRAINTAKAIKVKIAASPRRYYLYALELEDGMYYVGMTAYHLAVRRFEQHQAGHGAKWTRLHKPIRILEVRDIGCCMQNTAGNAENLMTREYMALYGMYKVRGGDLCYIKDTLVALHFNDNGVKTRLIDGNGKRVKRSSTHIRRLERVQAHVAAELSWIV